MAALNKEVRSLDEDNWMFDGPLSHIHLLSRSGQLPRGENFTSDLPSSFKLTKMKLENGAFVLPYS